MRRGAILLLAVALAGCGKKTVLKEPDGVPLPAKPATAAVQPQPADLLVPSTQSRPTRFTEVVTESQELQPSRFDLPPP